MAKLNKDYDIKKVFAETKDALSKDMVKSEGRIAMLTELEQFFETNHLKVVQEVEVPDAPKAEEKEDKKAE